MTTINAFHPDYIKTYHPEFLTDLRVESRMKTNGQNLSKHVDKKRQTTPSHGTVFGISAKVTSVTPIGMLQIKEFHIYQKAGMPKKTRSQLMTEIVAKKLQSDKNYGTVLRNSKNIPKNIPKGL